MPRKNNNMLILVVFIILVVAFGVYCAWNKSFDGYKNEDDHNKREKLNRESNQSARSSLPPPSQAVVEMVPRSDGAPEDDIEIISQSDDPAFQLGFGMGPGLYGSGRHTSEMIGN